MTKHWGVTPGVSEKYKSLVFFTTILVCLLIMSAIVKVTGIDCIENVTNHEIYH